MVFSNLSFIFIFLPIFLIIYAAVPRRFKNTVLFLGSIVFYVCGTIDRPIYVLLILVSVSVNYVLGMLIGGTERHKKLWLIAGLFYNFAWLFVFKYADFLFGAINVSLNAISKNIPFRLPHLGLLLPVGISFYTFQSVSYLADVYKGKICAERSLIKFGTYICMYPQLVAGPIVTYSEISSQLESRRFGTDTLLCGIKTFIWGLGFKVLLANRIGSLWSDIGAIGFDSISAPLAWMGAAAFTFQIYFDFYGYSMMAIGLGQMLGFKLPQNFHHPYLSISMTDFWRRWHITLGSWFREYVYIPLGGNRKGKARTVFNLFVVWTLTGIWHGASLNFLLWGFVIFVLISLEKFGIGHFLEQHRAVGRIYMILCVPLTWMIFAITDFSQMQVYFSRLFFFGGTAETVFSGDFIKYGHTYGILLIICLFFCTKLPIKLYSKIKRNALGSIVLLIIFWASVYCLYIGLNDPFLYFRF